MKKFISGLVSAASIFTLAACGTADDGSNGSGEETKELVVGASNVPHAEILEKAKPILEEKGIDLKIENSKIISYQIKT